MGNGVTWAYDMHFHLAWVLPDIAQFVEASQPAELAGLAVTVAPAEYESLVSAVPRSTLWAPALGCHPWFTKRDEATLAQFAALAQTTHAIGEVGLDFRTTPASERAAAVTFFERLCQAIRPDSVISLHAVEAASFVLDALEKTGRLSDCTCIFHWFSDSGDTFVRARKAHCLFSANPKQVCSRRGYEYMQQVPPAQLLFETDCPKDSRRTITPKEVRMLLEFTANHIDRDLEMVQKQSAEVLQKALA